MPLITGLTGLHFEKVNNTRGVRPKEGDTGSQLINRPMSCLKKRRHFVRRLRPSTCRPLHRLPVITAVTPLSRPALSKCCLLWHPSNGITTPRQNKRLTTPYAANFTPADGGRANQPATPIFHLSKSVRRSGFRSTSLSGKFLIIKLLCTCQPDDRAYQISR